MYNNIHIISVLLCTLWHNMYLNPLQKYFMSLCGCTPINASLFVMAVDSHFQKVALQNLHDIPHTDNNASGTTWPVGIPYIPLTLPPTKQDLHKKRNWQVGQPDHASSASDSQSRNEMYLGKGSQPAHIEPVRSKEKAEELRCTRKSYCTSTSWFDCISCRMDRLEHARCNVSEFFDGWIEMKNNVYLIIVDHNLALFLNRIFDVWLSSLNTKVRHFKIRTWHLSVAYSQWACLKNLVAFCGVVDLLENPNLLLIWSVIRVTWND
jgi:hypothetical protein